MRIAITTTGTTLDSEIDPRFGRAGFILVVDRDGTLIEVIDNSRNREAMSGTGIQAAKTLADKNVDVLLTGRCGPNAMETLRAAHIEFKEVQPGTAREVLDRFNRGEITGTSDREPASATAPRNLGTGRGGGGGRGKGMGRGMGRGGGRRYG
jgi:predicted Fe-Mo cluster-binding NifX family protein